MGAMNNRTKKRHGNEETSLERTALLMTSYIGSPISLIIHSIFFVGIFGLQLVGFSFEEILLILTTIVSLEAIYLSIFIQITVNHQAKRIKEVGEDVEVISEDVEEISKDIDDIQEDVEEISKDIDDIQEDVEEISGETEVEGEQKETLSPTDPDTKIAKIEHTLEELLREIRTIPRK
jgi:methyl-accepting chemotaxis protein